MIRRCSLALSLAFILTYSDRSSSAEPVDFVRDIKPILSKHCATCHAGKHQRGGLRMDTARAIFKGGDTGPAVVPGKAAESLLVQAITRSKGVKAMPPKETLPAEAVALLTNWIDQGAKVPPAELADNGAKSTHWAFQVPKRVDEPTVKNAAWVHNPIDRFILAALEAKNIAPSPEADRVTLVRRLYLDLLGLPPTPLDVDDFVNDSRPDAYERLVERLLASPHYGERQARFWLDQARYADSNGYTIDSARSIWKYRDWVINSFNQDKPFDQFTLEQIAGDLLPNATQQQKIATGFHRNTQKNEEGGIDVEQFRVDSIVDRVNTTGSVWLGLTVGCCQCHDHKFDPIAQREYYQFFAFLNSCDEPTLELPTPDQVKERAAVHAELAAKQKQLKLVETTTDEQITTWENTISEEDRARLPKEVRDILLIAVSGRSKRQDQLVRATYRQIDSTRHIVGCLGDPFGLSALTQIKVLNMRANLESEINALKAREPKIVTTMVVQERKTPRMTNIHIQGDFTRKGAAVKPGVPAVLNALPEKADYTRLDLAHWLVDPANPLTARVTMNRLWLHHFGIGIVETENDFGIQGTPPSHPELLDWLATEFIRQKWSVKAMERLIVTSATYRQSSKTRPDLATVDARNRLLAHMPRIRLEAESVRDAALTASGLLTRTIGGPSVYPPQPDGVFRFTQVPRQWIASTGPDRYRRGMYTWFWRSAPHPGLTVFDAPDAGTTCTRRNRSNTPLQALTLLNDQAYVEFAQALALRVLTETKADDAERMRHAFRLCMGRSPAAKEQDRLLRLLNEQRAEFAEAPKDAELLVPKLTAGTDVKDMAAWTMVTKVLLNLDEFITRE
jgi:hypothetical protein